MIAFSRDSVRMARLLGASRAIESDVILADACDRRVRTGVDAIEFYTECPPLLSRWRRVRRQYVCDLNRCAAHVGRIRRGVG